jgi:transposase
MGKPRRTFTREFKVEAVKLVTEQRRSFAEAAANLGIAESLLRKWKKALDDQGDQAFPGKGNLPALEDELRRLRAENKRLQMERDILKKRRPSSPRSRCEVPLHRRAPQPVAGAADVPGVAGVQRRLLHLAGSPRQCPAATPRGFDP